jgi:hypothetical protein
MTRPLRDDPALLQLLEQHGVMGDDRRRLVLDRIERHTRPARPRTLQPARELVHEAIRAADARGCCNLPGCAFPPRPGETQHVETMLCDELVAAIEARDALPR